LWIVKIIYQINITSFIHQVSGVSCLLSGLSCWRHLMVVMYQLSINSSGTWQQLIRGDKIDS
jgi:hypothetical protein